MAVPSQCAEVGQLYSAEGHGLPIWQYTTGGVVNSSPAIGNDGTIYFGLWDNKVYALNGQTGVKLWEFVTGGNVGHSQAIGSDGTVYIGSG